jgi:MFS family permease
VTDLTTKFRFLAASFLTTNVLVLSIVSLLADLSTEMIQPILPLFLVGILGASYSIVGLVEGSSDATTSVVKVISGWYSDRFSRRKPFVISGYLPTAILKPLLYFVQTPLQVIAIRVPDRIGKGIRAAPRDALIAESVDKQDLGKAFGFHRASDVFGAVLGSVLGFVFLMIFTGTSSDIYRTIFAMSTIPTPLVPTASTKYEWFNPSKISRRKIVLGMFNCESYLYSNSILCNHTTTWVNFSGNIINF